MAAPHGDSSPRSDSLPASRPRGRTGLWLIGAKGGVATTVITGLAALARGTTEPHGLVTALSPCARLDLVGFDEIVITVAFLANHIKTYFGDGSEFGVTIRYADEPVPLGTAGAATAPCHRRGGGAG